MIIAFVAAADRHPGAIGQAIHRRLAQHVRLRLVVVSDDLERLEIVMHERQCVLFASEIVQRNVGPAIEDLEGIEDEERGVHGWLCEALGCGVGIKVLWLHVKGARCCLEFCLVNRRCEFAALEIEIAIPHLRLPLPRILACEVAAQSALVLLQDARHEACTGWQRLVFELLLAVREIDHLLKRQVFQVHHRQRGIDERPPRAFPGLHVVGLGHDVRPVTHARELGIVCSLHP